MRKALLVNYSAFLLLGRLLPSILGYALMGLYGTHSI